MNKKFTNYQKFWIYKKISHFFKKDTCFKYFQTEFILSEFYFLLMHSDSLTEFIQKLKNSETDIAFRLPRKESEIDSVKRQLYFEYPKISFQVLSLIECWDDICLMQKKFSGEELGDLFGEDFEKKNLDEDEEVKVPEYTKNRKCFGNKPNFRVRYYSEYLEDFSISSHERNLGMPLQVDYSKEYNLFNATVTTKCNDYLQDSKRKLLIIQTDLQAFYHKLNLKFLIEYFNNSYALRDSNLVKWIKKLEETHSYEGLPIGWVLSGFIANIILLDLNKKLNTQLNKKMKSNPLLRTIDGKFGINAFSYVDDFLILVPLRKSQLPKSKEIANEVMAISNEILYKQFENFISFHNLTENPNKCKSFVIDEFSVSKLKRNFHDMKLSVPAEVEFGFEINDLMVPHDPDLVLNERNQFSIGLTAARRTLSKGDDIRKQNIKELLENMRIKIQSTEGKYIHRVFITLTAIVEREENGIKFIGAKEGEIKSEVYKCIESIFKILYSRQNHPINEWAAFFVSLARFIYETDGDLEVLKKYYKSIKIKSKDDDASGVSDYLELIRLEIILLGNKKGINTKKFIGKNTFSNSVIGNIGKNYEYIILTRYSNSKKLKDISKKEFLSKGRRAILCVAYFKIFSKALAKEQLAREYLNVVSEFSKRRDDSLEIFLSHSLSILINQCSENQVDVILERLGGVLKNKQNSKSIRLIFKLIEYSKYFREVNSLSELERLKRQLEILKSIFAQRNKGSFWNEIHTRTELGSLFFAISYIFTCSRISEVYSFLTHILSPIEGEQWVPWRSSIISFQIVGDRSIHLLEAAYKLQVGTYRNERIRLNDLEKQLIDIERFIKEIEEEGSESLFSISRVNFEKLDPLYSNLRKDLKVTIAPISYILKETLNENTMDFKSDKVRKLLRIKIDAAIEEAISRKSSLLIIPEMTMPTKYLEYFLNKLAKHDIVFIAGMEYYNDGINAQNITIISIPVIKYLNPLGKNHLLFNQVKNFPMAEEMQELRNGNLNYKSNHNLYIFQTKFWSNFSVLTCSDFLSLTLRWKLQKKVQTIIIPAQNYDNSTYDALANACIRDLHCIAIICNNGALSKSFTYAPFYKEYNRSVIEHAGLSNPEFHTFKIFPEKIKFVQEVGRGDVPFRIGENKVPNPFYTGNENTLSDFKQLPPDWNYF
ncbi:reverse transcriptase domain-containing protein [Leptospira weilii]|uniref:reverse transcriptase domain-containing protein n=1 Tax=Leptospira weilii TaxID=28184 RepID=UPI00055FB617|nr:reverse transcriptase domain-containing protein [Leptospira weilii]